MPVWALKVWVRWLWSQNPVSTAIPASRVSCEANASVAAFSRKRWRYVVIGHP